VMDPTLGMPAVFGLCLSGALGAFGGLCARDGRLALPAILKEGPTGRELALGFLAPIAGGATVGLLAAGNMVLWALPIEPNGPRGLVAAAAGFVFAVGGPAVLNTILYVAGRKKSGKEE